MALAPPSTVKVAGCLLFVCALLSLRLVFVATSTDPVNWRRPSSVERKPVHISYTPPLDDDDVSSNNANAFLATFERSMGSAHLSLPPGHDSYVPLIVRKSDGRILCRGSHLDVLSKSRVKSYIEMLSEGMRNARDESDAMMMNYPTGLTAANNNATRTSSPSGSLPVILIESDSSGCEHNGNVDHVGFPRLTWHVPSPKHGDGWCQAVGMVGYESWNSFKNKRQSRKTMLDRIFNYNSWDWTFRWYQWRYPWSSKIDKAVWRGSTTGQVSPLSFDELPRAKLVKAGMDRPDLINAGFTSFVQGFESMEDDVSTISVKSLRFDDQMRYRAIVDIDGNTWSSRFVKLLCTNSVVIKIDPDYIEYFYEDLSPMKHFVPASLSNITEVVEYVVSKANDAEMRSIVESANSLCERTNTRERLARDAVDQLGKFEAALYDAYGTDDWLEGWKRVERRIRSNVGEDLVDCSF